MTMDPYNSLSTEEQNLVDELLFGPQQDVVKSSITSSSPSVLAKGHHTRNEAGTTTTVTSDDHTSTSFRSRDSTEVDAIRSVSSSSSFRDVQSEASSIRGGGDGMASKLKRKSWGALGDDSDDFSLVLGVGGGCESLMSGFGCRTEVDESLKITIPGDSTTTTSASLVAEPSRKKTDIVPTVYAKNKKLLDLAEASRFKKAFEEVSSKKVPRTSVVLKHLNNISLSIMKDGKDDRDIVAALNGINILCKNILQNPKFVKHNKVVAISVTILAYLAKGSQERRDIIFQEYGALVVLSCMQSFKTKESLVHEESVIALYNFVQNDSIALQITETPQALAVILRTMKSHQSRHAVQKACFGILLRLAHADFDYIAKPEVFDLCLSSLSKIKLTNLQLHKVGCIFWRQVVALADDDGFEIKIMIKSGILDHLLQVLRGFSNEPYIAKNVLATFSAIGERNKEALVFVATNLGDIFKIFMKHKTDVDTHREAYKLLRLLRNLPSGSLKIPKAMAKDDEVRQAFFRAQIDPNRVVPV